MGYSTYSFLARSVRTESFKSKSSDDIFTQNKEHKMHESMNPAQALLRESRDSELHPLSVPIIISLDVTGSMSSAPNYLVKEGLPFTIKRMMEKGVADPQILFTAIGDHVYDNAPLQVGQFESGDEELDLWLTRTWLEKGGGGNRGESYLLAWYYAANHTVTDSFEKRGKKGFLISVGDEPCLPSIPKREVAKIMGVGEIEGTYSSDELLKAAQEKYEVYHIHFTHGGYTESPINEWKNRLGEKCFTVDRVEEISELIARIVGDNASTNVIINNTETTQEEIL